MLYHGTDLASADHPIRPRHLPQSVREVESPLGRCHPNTFQYSRIHAHLTILWICDTPRMIWVSVAVGFSAPGVSGFALGQRRSLPSLAERLTRSNAGHQPRGYAASACMPLLGMIGFSPLSESPGNPLITASSARTRPSPGFHACKRRSARVPRLVWLEPLWLTRRRDWLQAIGAW